MKTEKKLYIKILIWAYEKSNLGIDFTDEDIVNEFNLKKDVGGSYCMYERLFRACTPALID